LGDALVPAYKAFNPGGEMSEQNTFYPDLIKALGEIPNLVKSGFNPHLKTNYLAIEDILLAVKPVLLKNNLGIMQDTWTDETKLCVQTILVHSSGKSHQSSVLKFHIHDAKPQSQGALLSYLRRYQLMTFLSLSGGDRDLDSIDQPASRAVANAQALKAKKVEVSNDDI